MRRPRIDLLGPLFRQELLRLGRRGSNFRLRVAVVGVLLLALWAVYPGDAKLSINQQADAARFMFLTLLTVQLVCVLLVAPVFAAAVLTEEREQKTLDLLLTTTLTNRDLALGKLAARLVFVGGVVLAGLPVFALLTLLGGVTFEAVILGYLATYANLWSVGGFTAAVAANSASYRAALVIAWVCLLVALACPFTNPWFVTRVLDGDKPMHAAVVGGYLGFHMLAGAFGVWLAARAVRPWETDVLEEVRLKPRPAEDKPAVVVPRRPVLVSETAAPADRGSGSTVDFSWDDPPGPCDGPGEDSTTLCVIAAATVLGVLVGLAATEPRYAVEWPPYMLLGYLPAALFTAVLTAGTVTREREGDTLTMLLTVPPGRGEILWRKAVAAARRLAWLWLLSLVFGGLVVLLTIDGWYWAVGYAALGPAALAAAVGVSVWLSATCRTTFLAQSSALLASMCLGVLPWWGGAAFDERGHGWAVPVLFAALVMVAVTAWQLARTAFAEAKG